MVSGKNCDVVEKTVKWLCALCGKGVRSNSVQCRHCGGWVDKCCSDVKSSLSTTGDEFICETVGDGEDINIQESLDLGNSVCLERVRKFCYLENMLSVVGTENSVLVGRVPCRWGKFKVDRDLDKE